MWCWRLCVCSLLLLLPLVVAKQLSGVVSSHRAWEENGQFVTKFCFRDQKGLFNYSVDRPSEGKFYFFLDETWPYVLGQDDCYKKLAMAKFSVELTNNTRGSHFVNQWIRPHFWFLVYADPSTCQHAPPPSNEVIEYEMLFLNPDANGDATDQFGDNDRGLLTFYTLLILVYCAGLALYAHRVWVAISKGGPMHEVLKMLSVVMAMHFSAALLMWVHLWRYSINGRGVLLFAVLSELLEMLAQCQMVWLLLSMSVGWTLGSPTAHPVRDRRQLATIAVVAFLHVVFVLWEQLYDEGHFTYHVHESPPGWLLLLLRLALAGLFAGNLRSTLATERSALRRDFYQNFSFGCYLWFLAFPVLMLLTTLFAPYLRHKVVTVGVTVIQTVAMVMLSRLFLSRSLYWEVSTLSATTLPLRLGREGGVAGLLTRIS